MEKRARRLGFTLLEVVVTVIVLMILIQFAMPTYRVAVEQNRLDLAASRLLMIYTAQRMYFVDKGEYATDIYKLTRDAKLLDRALEPGAGGDAKYFYSTTANNTLPTKTFTALATRTTTPEPQYWSGTIQLDHLGQLTGSIVSGDGTRTLTASKYALGL